jgi:hypothetical protein
MTDAIFPIIISSLGTASAFGVVATFLLKQQAKATADRLAAAEAGAREAVAQVAALRDETVKAVSDKVDDHIKADKSQAYGTQLDQMGALINRHIAADKSQTYGAKLDQMGAQLTKMDQKLDRIAETTANQDAKIEGTKEYVRNLDDSLQRHKDGPHHA